MKTIIFTGVLVMLFTLGCHASVYKALTLKKGTLTHDEIWSGKILLAEDVVVPEGITLTLNDGTWIIINNFDPENRGYYPDRTELIVKGSLDITNKASLMIMPVTDPRLRPFLSASADETRAITPLPYDAKELQRHWRDYRHQYSIVWSLMYGILLL